MNELAQNILNHIQTEFPLVERPFQHLAELFKVSEIEVINTIKSLKDELCLIRTISAIFDAKKLGYNSVLVAFEVFVTDFDRLIERLNLHPGVSHNYSRKHAFNLWFTLALSDNRDIDAEIDRLAKQFKVSNYLILPSIKTYKLNVNFKVGHKNNSHISNSFKTTNTENIISDDLDKLIIKQLQEELPLIVKPFDQLAKAIDISGNEFLKKASLYKASNIMRRYCATLRHIKAGYVCNAMVVWKVDKTLIDDIGLVVSEKSYVSHCYQRKEFDNWPYNFYTMVHATSENNLNDYLEELKQTINPSAYEVLETIKEHKKTRVKYFFD